MTYSRNSLWTQPDTDGIDGPTMDAWLRARGPSGAQFVGLPYREPPAGTGQAVIDECKPYGINPVLKMAQIAHETANLQSHIVRDKNNPSGIGAVNDNAYEGAHTYQTLQEGIRASVAHLLGYLAGDGPWNALSPRYELVKKAGNAGKVRTLADLEQKWAWSPPERYNATPVDRRYGGMIAAKANDLVAFAKSREPQPEEPPVSVPISGLKDIRHRLQTATDGKRGPLRTVPMSRKRGVVIHYRGVVTTPAPGYDSFTADATYHVNRDWGQGYKGDGIMYHVGIGWDGVAYWMRDFNRVLWHCGVTKYNEEALAIQLPMGGNQRATPEMLATLERVVDEWRTATGTPRSEVWGHSEMPGQSTACPGTLLADFVQKYRAKRDDAPEQPDALFVADNPFGNVPIIGGFRALFLETGKAKHPDDPIAGGLSIFGYPEGPEFVTDDGSAQIFERIIMRYHRGAPAPWDIVATLRHEDIPEAA